MAVLVAATATLVRRAGATATAIALAALIVASASLVWIQPSGAGMAGLFVAVAFAGIRLPEAQSMVALVLAAAAFVAPAVHADRSAGMIAGTELGIVAFYLVARFGRSAAEAHEQTRRLLVELQATRDAEVEAAMLRERSRLAQRHARRARAFALGTHAPARRSPDTVHPARRKRPAVTCARPRPPPRPRRTRGGPTSDRGAPTRIYRPRSARAAGHDFERDTRIQTSLIHRRRPARGQRNVLTVYRVAQEALTNVRRHASPERVEVTLRYDEDGTRLTVSDHAERPAPPSAAPRLGGGGYGLTGMRERAELLGGSLQHRSHG